MKVLFLLTFLLLFSSVGFVVIQRNVNKLDQAEGCDCNASILGLNKKGNLNAITDSTYYEIRGALLASRFESIEELKKVIKIEYFNNNKDYSDSGNKENTMVRLTHCSNGKKAVSILESGICQGDIIDIRDGDLFDRIGLVFSSPYSVSNRIDLNKVYLLARRRDKLFGVGDVAYYDLAEAMVSHIKTKDLAYKNEKDSGEKGYINSFNHITAQAIITTCFSEEMADFVSALHERYYMPELTNGMFTEEQLADPENNPVDNYVDIINNEWGQEIGKKLKADFNISRSTFWTPELLANYLNAMQSYYIWAFQIGMKPFRPDDEVIVRFTNKLNTVMEDAAPLTWS